MNIGDLSLDRFATQLAKEGGDPLGPVRSHGIVSKLPELAAPIHLLYADFPIEPPGSICDFHICARPAPCACHGPGVRRKFCSTARPYAAIPRRWALPMFEWGLRASIARPTSS